MSDPTDRTGLSHPTARPANPPQPGTAMRNADWLRLFLLSLLWGGSFFFGEIAVEALPPVTLAGLRVSLAALTLVLLLAAGGRLANFAAWPWPDLLVMGLLNNAIPFSLILWGQSEIDSGPAAILTATTPFWTLVLATWMLPSDGLTPRRLAGLLLGLAGVAVLIGPDALEGLGSSLWHEMAVLGAALSYGCAALWGRRLKGLTVWQAAGGQLIGSSLILLPLALVLDQPWSLPFPGLAESASVLGLALLSTALAYLLYFRILRNAGPANLSLVTMLVPASALLLGALFLGEQLGRTEAAGLAFVLAGLIVLDGRIGRIFSSKQTF